MPAHRVRRRRLDRFGVKILRLRSGAHVARYVDPISRRQVQVNLDRLGLSSQEARTRWAHDKARSTADLRAKVAAGHAVADRVPLGRAVADYLTTFENARTVASKRIVLEAVREWLEANGVRETAQLTLPVLLRWRDQYLRPSENGHEASTRNRWLATVGAWLRWASGRGMVPLLGIDAIREGTKRTRQARKEIQFLRPAQVKALLQALARHDDDAAAGGWRPMGAFFLTLLLTGARYAEVAGLRWDEVYLADGYIELGAARVKTKSSRRITLAETPALRRLLQALALRRGDAELVFGDFTYGTLQHALARLVKDYGAPRFTPHMLRRTAGTILTCSSIYGTAGSFLSAKRLGHGVQLAEKHYVGALHGLAPDARTFEEAADIVAECGRIVEQSGGIARTVPQAGAAV
jgi:integrase